MCSGGGTGPGSPNGPFATTGCCCAIHFAWATIGAIAEKLAPLGLLGWSCSPSLADLILPRLGLFRLRLALSNPPGKKPIPGPALIAPPAAKSNGSAPSYLSPSPGVVCGLAPSWKGWPRGMSGKGEAVKSLKVLARLRGGATGM